MGPNLYLHYIGDGRLALSERELRSLVADRGPWRALDQDGAASSLSFDDAHVSMTAAARVLRDVPVALFVPVDFVETSTHFLDWDGVRALRDAGWSIGSHSCTHPRMGLRFLHEDRAAYRARLDEECQRSRETLRRELGVEVTAFAYPYGEADDEARAAVARAGYERAYTVAGDMSWDGDPLRIPRLDAQPRPAPTSDAPVGISVIVPAYERPALLAEVVTRLASQSYPEERYEVLVVDDGSESDLSPIFAEMPANVRLHRGKGGRTFQAGQARQYGAEHARFDYLAFLDADVAVDADHLWHLDWIHRQPGEHVVFGELSGYNLHDLEASFGRPDRHTLERLAPLGATNARIADRQREPVLRACLDNLEWLTDPWRLCYTGNLSLPRTLLERIGGFAADFEGWGLEDVDLGVRLQRAGARFVFSRWAVGYHLVEPGEPVRNPFRTPTPLREDFARYERNLDLLAERHAADAEVQAFVASSRRDIEETCARPETVGIECGGHARGRSHVHAQLHRVRPGGVPLGELLDRVAYARKVGARYLYLLGGEVAERRDLPQLLEAATGFDWVALQTQGHPFVDPELAARLHEAGLRGVTVLLFALDAHEAVFGTPADPLRAALAHLRESALEVDARIVLTPETAGTLAAMLEELRALEIPVGEIGVTDESLAAEVRAAGHEPCTATP